MCIGKLTVPIRSSSHDTLTELSQPTGKYNHTLLDSFCCENTCCYINSKSIITAYNLFAISF